MKKSMFTKEEKYISDSELQKDASSKISGLLKNSQIPEEEISKHLTLFIERIPLQNIIFMYEIWKKILNVHGVVAEFGTRYGDNLALFLNLRGVLEPFNRSRKILGFDTFSGFVRVDENDGNMAEIGDLSTTIDYEDYLEKVLENHEKNSPINHLKKYEIIKGDAPSMLKDYLKRHPETIFSFCYFDMDLYQPTKECIEILKDRLPKGAILGFDEVCYENFPGETLALIETFELKNIELKRTPISSSSCYFQR